MIAQRALTFVLVAGLALVRSLDWLTHHGVANIVAIPLAILFEQALAGLHHVLRPITDAAGGGECKGDECQCDGGLHRRPGSAVGMQCRVH